MAGVCSEAKLFNLLTQFGLSHYFQRMLDYGFDHYDDFQFAINDVKARNELLQQIGMPIQEWEIILGAYLDGK
jgi:hypothetical protein